LSENLTMAQMAEELSVSRRVVSAVINNKLEHVRVSNETKIRIMKYLDQRGYVQSKSALQIKNEGKVDTIGILYCGQFMPYSHLISALSYLTEKIEDKFGLVEIIGISPDKINDGVREMVAKGIRRLIWIHDTKPKEEQVNAKKLFPLLARMDNVVIYNYLHCGLESEYLQRGIDLVGFDRLNTYTQVINEFKNAGHSKVAINECMFHDPQLGPHGSLMHYSFCKEHGLEVFGLCPKDVKTIPQHEHALILADNLIYHFQNNGVKSAFIRNDMMANAVIDILTSKGIKVPADISIIGFGDQPMNEFRPISLTTFRHPVREMCEKTLELIDRQPSATGERYEFDNEFILRKSHISK